MEAVRSIAVSDLGFDPDSINLNAPEAVAALLRRAGAFHCPCPPSLLIETVTAVFEGFELDPEELQDSIEEMLESLVGYGDFIESRDIAAQTSARLLYAAPPRFVSVSDSTLLLFGIYPDGKFPTEMDIGAKITFDNYRVALHDADINTRSRLLDLGILGMEPAEWLSLPSCAPPGKHVWKYDERLVVAGDPGTIAEMILLDPKRSVRFYPARWVPLKAQTGFFVARRPQPFGADLWCYVSTQDGVVKKLLDLPIYERKWRPCDEAFHLQQAIDSVRGTPQAFLMRDGLHSYEKVLDFFSPVPLWARRRWDYVGRSTASPGCLFSYTFHTTQVDAEIRFAEEQMWMTRHEGTGR
jgi:hypothetical protein